MCGYKLHIRSLYSKIDLQSLQRGFILPDFTFLLINKQSYSILKMELYN